MEDGTFCRTFEQCLIRPGFQLGSLMFKDAVWYALWTVKKIKVAMFAKKPMLVRFQAPIIAGLVRCLKDNSRFVSVSTHMKLYSKTLYSILTEHCKMDNLKTNFIIKEKKTGDTIPIVTNTAALMAIISYLYVMDRKHSAFTVSGSKNGLSWEKVLEIAYKKDSVTYLKEFKKLDVFTDTKTEWLKVYNPCRGKLLSLKFVIPKENKGDAGIEEGAKKKKKSKKNSDDVDTLIPGIHYQPKSGVSNFGDTMLQGWEENEPQWWLDGMVDPDTNEPESLRLDELIHAISTIGFASQTEEEANFINHEKQIKANNFSAKKVKTKLQRRIEAIKRFLTKLENEFPLFVTSNGMTETPRDIMERLWTIHSGGDLKDILFDKRVTKTKVQQEQPPGTLKYAVIRKIVDAEIPMQELDNFACQAGMHFHRFAFMVAYQKMMTESNHEWDARDFVSNRFAEDHYGGAEGPLIKAATEIEKRKMITIYKRLIKKAIEDAKRDAGGEDQIDYDDPTGKKIILD